MARTEAQQADARSWWEPLMTAQEVASKCSKCGRPLTRKLYTDNTMLCKNKDCVLYEHRKPFPMKNAPSISLEHYTIEIKRFEDGIFQAQLKELPGVITTTRYWSDIPSMVRDALRMYVLSLEPEADSTDVDKETTAQDA